MLTTGLNLIEELGHLFWLIIMSIFINLGHRMFQNRGLLFSQTFHHIQFFLNLNLLADAGNACVEASKQDFTNQLKKFW